MEREESTCTDVGACGMSRDADIGLTLIRDFAQFSSSDILRLPVTFLRYRQLHSPTIDSQGHL